jgi:hypothetical protein
VEDNLIEAMVTFYEQDVVENMNQVKKLKDITKNYWQQYE